jgi:predicted house-cleaning NTP pyrophosphatase (Maf/HAM1 superfamily)
LVYGQEAIVALHFRHHTLEIAKVLKLDIGEVKHERLFQLQKLEEDIIIALQHQEAQKQQQKAWHNRNIKSKKILVGHLVLLYDKRIKGKPHKQKTAWMGPYIIKDLNSNGSV